jgi:hypothetical protein
LPAGTTVAALIAETVPVSERLRMRGIDDDEGRRLVRIVRQGSGSVVTWRRAQMVLLSAQGMDVAAIAKVAFTSEDRVRDVIRDDISHEGLRALLRSRGRHLSAPEDLEGVEGPAVPAEEDADRAAVRDRRP